MEVAMSLDKNYPVRLLQKVLGFSRSSYYAFKERLSNPEVRDEALRKQIAEVALRRPSYGYRRVTHELKREGLNVNHKRIYSLMKADGLLCKRKRKWTKTTDSEHGLNVFPNLVPTLDVTGINQLWAGDITYIALGSKFIYLSTLLDTFSRRCVGWALSRTIDSQLCLKALAMATKTRGISLEGLVHHTDRGSQYASSEYKQALANSKIKGSMSRKGNPYDNGFAESLFKTLKYESIYRCEQTSFSDTQELIKRTIDDYNRSRLHSSIGYRPPAEFEESLLIYGR